MQNQTFDSNKIVLQALMWCACWVEEVLTKILSTTVQLLCPG